MREIRFRAWDKENKRMENCISINPFHISDCDRIIWKRNEVVLMQYTSLKDKNGKEIYEGDIIHLIEVTNEKLREYVSKVEWDTDCFIISCEQERDTPLGIVQQEHFQYPLTECKIIGNIYENPELIEI